MVFLLRLKAISTSRLCNHGKKSPKTAVGWFLNALRKAILRSAEAVETAEQHHSPSQSIMSVLSKYSHHCNILKDDNFSSNLKIYSIKLSAKVHRFRHCCAAAGEAHSVNPLSDFSQTQKWPWAWLLAKYTKSKREARNKLTYLAPIVTQVRPHKIWPLLAKVTFMMVRAAINAHHTIPSICFSIVSQFSYNDVGR